MLIIPAIDLKGGMVVRLTQGAFDAQTVYSQAPADVMLKWQKEGARLVHVVDLDGAREGVRKNLGSLKNILAVAKIPIQFGGGLRTFEAVQDVLKVGVRRVVIGTKAFDTQLLKRLVQAFGDRVAVGLDIRNGVIQTEGWQSGDKSLTPEKFCEQLEAIGVRTIVVTDVTRDGMMQGPNVELLKKLLKTAKINLIASGGMAS
ncbi:MAG TPA: HisA/HisF-related TIM barrel protein, partial [Candidatus Omnitrophota bacterium]|nr:HisA/HisF-related TIM barrel protein [Candidatus Omnitrophota bacterium]